MANGDVEYTFLGNPNCPICGALAGTTDSQPIPPPHENCQCENEAKCVIEYGYEPALGGFSAQRYGPNGECFSYAVEIVVICADGSELGESISIDFGCVGADYQDDWDDVLWDRVAEIAAELAEGCPPCQPESDESPLIS
jgi:hypothetical protein